MKLNLLKLCLLLETAPQVCIVAHGPLYFHEVGSTLANFCQENLQNKKKSLIDLLILYQIIH